MRLTYSINAMAWGTVELEPEIRDWLEHLPIEQFATVAFYIDLLSEEVRCWTSRTRANWTASSASFGSISIGRRCA